MVWGCMMAKGVSYIAKIEGNINADLYCQILRYELMNTIHYYDLNEADIIFQQDNDPKHTSNMAKACLNELGLKVLE